MISIAAPGDAARKEGLCESTEQTKTPAQVHTIEAAIAIVIRDGQILVCQRKDDDVLGGFWEFPGGSRECGESLEDCLKRELLEEIGIVAAVVAALSPIEHAYGHGTVRLHPFICHHVSGEPQLIECQAALWIVPRQLLDFRFPPANESLLAEVLEYLSQPGNG